MANNFLRAGHAPQGPAQADGIFAPGVLPLEVPSHPMRARIDAKNRAVIITFRMAGTLVMQRIPLSRYNGVVAELVAADERTDVRLVLRHPDPAHSIVLSQNVPFEDAVAEWRAYADRYGLPLLLREENGIDAVIRPMIGSVALGKPVPHKRAHAALKGRRPRYAKRRGRR